MHNRGRSTLLYAALLAVALLLTACGGGSGTGGGPPGAADSTAERERLARAEGSLTVLGRLVPRSMQDSMVAAMRDRYGVTVDWLQTSAPETLERLRAGELAGQAGGDIALVGDQYGSVLKEDGFLQEAAYPNDPGQWQFARDPEGFWMQYAAVGYGVLVNTGKVGPGWPATWDDLAKPPNNSQILLDDPARGSVGLTWAHAVRNDMMPIAGTGSDYLGVLGRLPNFGFTSSPPDAYAQVARGDIGVVLPVGANQLSTLEGAGSAVKIVFPDGAPLLGAHGIGVVAGTPHPNAAQMFVDLLLSDEMQTMLTELEIVPSNRSVHENADYEVPLPNPIGPLDVESLSEAVNDVDTIKPELFHR